MRPAQILLALILCGPATAADAPSGLQHDVVFTETAPLAAS